MELPSIFYEFNNIHRTPRGSQEHADKSRSRSAPRNAATITLTTRSAPVLPLLSPRHLRIPL